MIRRSGIDGPPASFVAGEWPDADVPVGSPDAVRYARIVSLRLREAVSATTVSGLADEADLNRSTIQDVLAGRTWCDFVTLVKLSEACGQRLMPGPEEL